MCGIAGIVAQKPVHERIISTMCDTIAHRGPDDVGTRTWDDHGVALGHRRLSIIDLSAAGHNPMSNEDGTVWIVFNGEIYNFQSLRQELLERGHQFRSNTDTEVIIHAYEEWGDAHVHRLRGMFAYALYDRRPFRIVDGKKQEQHFRMLLVRDRPGIKPLFYSWHNGVLLFGSEIKALLAYPGIDRTIDRSAIFDFLTYRYVPAPKTSYTHIRKLPAAHLLVLEDERLHIEQYWDVPLGTSSPVQTCTEAIELVQSTLYEAVQLHMVSDVPVGVFLSGGMDSSIITALMAQVSPDNPLYTFSIGFDVPGHSETEYAQIVARQYETTHFEGMVGSDMMSNLPLATRLYDEPFGGGSWGPTYRVSELARDHVKVVLSGDGGDEIFAGYKWYGTWYHAWKWQERAAWLPPLKHVHSQATNRYILQRIGKRWPKRWPGRDLVHHLGANPVDSDDFFVFAPTREPFSPAQKRTLLAPEWSREFADYDDYWYFRQYWHPELDIISRLQYIDFKTLLCDSILTKVDRASMAVSLEVRPPLLDHVLVEQLFSIPTKLRMQGGELKGLLKQTVQGLLPPEILTRPKKGFGAPWSTWMNNNVQWNHNVVQSQELAGLLQADAVQAFPFRMWQKWFLLSLQQWFQHEQNNYS